MTSATKSALITFGLILIALFLTKDALLFGGAYFERDLLSIYGPTAQAFVRAIAEGSWPLRDPTTGFGQPLLGNPDAQIPYPPNWLNLIMLPERAYAFIGWFHFVLGAVGAAAIAFQIGGSFIGAFFAGAFWLVGGPFQSFLSVWHHFAGAAWMPWVLLAFIRLLERPGLRRSLITGGAFGLQVLSGSADMCAMTLTLALLLLCCGVGRSGARGSLRQWAAAVFALLVGLALGAATWMTVAEIFRSSLRASLPEEIRTYWSIHPALTAELVLPLRLGSQSLAAETKNVLFEGREPFVRSLFLGPLVMPLFLAGLRNRRVPAAYRWFFGLGVFAILLVALGKFTPVYGMVTRFIPPFQIFRYPSKLIVPVSLLCCVLAGIGVSQLHDAKERSVARRVTFVLIGLHLGVLLRLPELLAALLNTTTTPVSQQPGARHVELSLLAALCSLVLLARALRSSQPRFTAVAACVGVVATLFANEGLNPVVARSVLRYRSDNVALVRTSEPSRLFVEDYEHFPERVKSYLGRDLLFQSLKGEGLPRAVLNVIAFRSTLAPPSASEWGIEYGWDMDLRGLFQEKLRRLSALGLELEGSRAFLRLLQLANVSKVADLHTSTFGSLSAPKSVDTPLPESLYLFDVPGFLPRAYAVSGVRVSKDPNRVDEVLDPRFQPEAEVLLEAGESVPASSGFRGLVNIVRRRCDQVVLNADLNQTGSVVLLEGFLPGWRASIDGVAAPVHRANAVFLAATVPAGRHEVIFTYRPWGAVIGISLTGVTFLALIIGLTVAPRPAAATFTAGASVP